MASRADGSLESSVTPGRYTHSGDQLISVKSARVEPTWRGALLTNRLRLFHDEFVEEFVNVRHAPDWPY